MPIVPKAEPRRSGGTPSRTIAAPFGKESAPARACWVRKMISTSKLGAKAQPAEAIANQANPNR